MPKTKILIKDHVLMPQHIKLNEKEKKEVFEHYHISLNELPKIMIDDPAIVSINAKVGDVIKIVRKSVTSREAIYYRAVVNA